MNNTETELIDLMDVIDFTLSSIFIEKWKYKHGMRLLKLFQGKLLEAFRKSKQLKQKALTKFLVDEAGFSLEVVNDFYSDIELDIYSPIVQLDSGF